MKKIHDRLFLKKSNFQIIEEGDKGVFRGIGILFGQLPDRPLFLSKGAFDSSCGKLVPLVKAHQDESDFKVVGTAKIVCAEDSINLEGEFNLTRDIETKNFMVPLAAEMFALVKEKNITGISAGIEFEEGDFEIVDENIIVKRADITEFSLVVNPAIDGARVTEVMNRHKEETNVNKCPAELIAVKAAFIKSKRRLQNA